MTTARPLIGIGERAPDFALPRDGDRPVRFYGLAGGRPTVLLFTGSDPAGTVAQLASSLAADGRLEVLVVARTATAGDDGAFRDTEGVVHRGYGAPEDEPVAIVLDRNLRVSATSAITDVEASRTAIVDALPPPAADDQGLAPRAAPVLFVPHALAPTLCDGLIDRWATEGSIETGVETVVEGARAEVTDIRRKRRRDHVVTDQGLLRELTQHIGARVFPELQKAFAFSAGGFEGFKIGCYAAEDAGHFEAHRDNLSTGTAHRRFGLTLNLNEDYEGGELRFPEYGPSRYRPAAGEALLFSGSHLHEVLPVTRGRRFVLLSFVLARGSQVARTGEQTAS